MAKLHVLIMAAGASKRMGTPKQLLDWGPQKLLRYQIEKIRALQLPYSVVLGAYQEEIRSTLDLSESHFITNQNWQNGLGTSIAKGVAAVTKEHSHLEGILVVLADQPLVGIEQYQKLLDQFEANQQQILVSQSEEGFTSPPVLFDACYFEELMQLEGDHGAKPLLQKYKEHVLKITSSSSLADMDTPEAYESLLQLFNRQS